MTATHNSSDELDKILDGLYCRGLNDARPDYYRENGTELTRKQAKSALTCQIQIEVDRQLQLQHADLVWCLGKLRGLGHPAKELENKYQLSKPDKGGEDATRD